jgi:hypothetical protein
MTGGNAAKTNFGGNDYVLQLFRYLCIRQRLVVDHRPDHRSRDLGQQRLGLLRKQLRLRLLITHETRARCFGSTPVSFFCDVSYAS